LFYTIDFYVSQQLNIMSCMRLHKNEQPCSWLGFIFSNSSNRSVDEDPQHSLTLNGNCPTLATSFLQIRCYKWWHRKCLGLSKVNLNIFILKIGQKSLKITKIPCLCSSFKKKFTKLQNFTTKRTMFMIIFLQIFVMEAKDKKDGRE
jgi:hypothetical protein